MELFTIIFEDDTIYKGKDYNDTGWSQIPDKKIKSIIYSLPLGDHLILSNYDSYYHFCEACVDLMGIKKGIKQLEFAYLIGKKRNDYRLYKINLKNGQIEINNLDGRDEFIKSLNPMGWK